MNPFKKLLLFLLLIAVFDAPSQQSALAQTGDQPVDYQTIVQVSTYDYFAAGSMDGIMPLSDLRRYGDFGLGTFDKLNGEMVEVEGQMYQVNIDGVPHLADTAVKTPFAVVTFFQAVQPAQVKAGLNLDALSKQLDLIDPSQNVFVAIRIDGKFPVLKLRSVPVQEKPYPPLTEIIKQQVVFDLTNVEGTLVGIRSPQLSKGLNAVGYHFHFISKDHRAGGHVLDLTTGDDSLQINEKPVWKLFLPN